MRKLALISAILCALCGAACRHHRAEPFVNVRTRVPSAIFDIRYATTNNFTHHQVYPIPACYLRPETASKLAAVEQNLLKRGLTLRIFDCYRPLSVQKQFWALVPDDRYVADPSKGSRHNRGAAVDLTLADPATGRSLDMGTEFDDFSDRAHRDYRDLPPAGLENRRTLEQYMDSQGFIGLPTEWWHFDDLRWQRYPISDEPFPSAPGSDTVKTTKELQSAR